MKHVRIAFVLLALLALPPSARAAEGPALETKESTLRAALACPASFDQDEGEPVLLVHGTFADAESNWSWNYLPALTAAGIDTCTVNLPDHSLGDMQVQAEYVVYAIRQIAARSGSLVDVIGASQGTLHPRWAIKWWPDVREAIDDYVSLAGPHHGTDGSTYGENFGQCYASCWQMSPTSNYIGVLNEGDETPSDISYTSLYTIFDELVLPQVPDSTSVLDGASNIGVQDLCPGRPVDHVSISTADAVAYAMALDALTHPGAADPARFEITTCAQATVPGATAPKGGSAGIDGEFVTAEPPLRAYARASSGSVDPPSPTPSPESAPAPSTAAPSSGGGSSSSDEVAVQGAQEANNSGGGALPLSGADILRIVAGALALIAGGGILLQTRASRRADRRILPASSRSGSDTNS